MQVKEPVKHLSNGSVSDKSSLLCNSYTTSLDYKVRLILHQEFLSHLLIFESSSLATPLFSTVPNPLQWYFFLSSSSSSSSFFFLAIPFLKYCIYILDSLPKQGNMQASNESDKISQGSYKDEQTHKDRC